jgi:hypothetical protein
MKIFIFLLTVIINLSALAVESSDILKVSIIKHYDENILVINRGLEDGIYKADHIKLTNQEGYIARAICIKASMLISHWKVYRVVRPELMSYDSVYTLTSMNQSEIPKDLKPYQKEYYFGSYNDISDKDVNKVVDLQQERIASFDLPKDMEYDPILEKAKKSETEVFLIKNFDAKQLKTDLSEINVSIYTSPISWQRQDDQKSINYGFNISNVGKKYEFNLGLDKSESKVVDQYSGTEVSSESTNIGLAFNINYITENVSYFMFSSYKQERQGELYYPRRQIQAGLVGFKYHIIENDPAITKFDFSYVTILDYMDFDSQSTDDDTFETETSGETRRTVRHSFRLRLNSNISEHASFNTTLWYKPAMDMSTQEVDFKDSMTDWNTSLSWALTESLSASYEFTYTYDINLKREFDQDPMNQINTVNIQYNFTL